MKAQSELQISSLHEGIAETVISGWFSEPAKLAGWQRTRTVTCSAEVADTIIEQRTSHVAASA